MGLEFLLFIGFSYIGIFCLVIMFNRNRKHTKSNTNRIVNLEDSVDKAWVILNKIKKLSKKNLALRERV